MNGIGEEFVFSVGSVMSLINNKFGWCYFKRGSLCHHGKNHYLPKGASKSRCGQWHVRDEEWKNIIFVPKEHLRERKICRNCESMLKISEHIANT